MRVLVYAMKELPVVRGGVVIAQCAVDDDVFDKLVGCPIYTSDPDVGTIRLRVFINGKYQVVSRYVIGPNPSDDDTMVVDHIDRNPRNNVRSNLRWLSRSDNVRNQRSKTASGYRGVVKNGNKWWAYFHSNGRKTHGGTYETAKEAALAADEMARRALGSDLDLILLNFPEESSSGGLSNIKRRVPTGFPRGITKKPNGTYQLSLSGYPTRRVETLEEATEMQAIYIKDRDDAKLAKRIVDGKIAIFDKAGITVGYTIVDDDMLYEVALKGPYLNTYGYATISIGGVTTTLHRYIYGTTIEGATVMPAVIDHIDNDRLNNLRSNLRASDASSNGHAKRKKSGTSSIYYGVSWNARRRTWKSGIRKDGICTIKNFTCELDAARFYNESAIRLYGTHAQLNELPSGSDGPTPVDDALGAPSNNRAKRKRSGTSSIYCGVTWNARRRMWLSRIMKDGILTSKIFTNELDAARFYNENAVRLHGAHAQLNELPSGSDGPTPVDDAPGA